MRALLIAIVVATGAAIWWLAKGANTPEPAAKRAPPEMAERAPAPTPAAERARPLALAPRTAIAEAQQPGAAQPTGARPRFSVVAALIIPGERSAVTLLVDGNSITVSEGGTIAGYRIERIARDRMTVVDIATGISTERAFDDLAPPQNIASNAPPAPAWAPVFAAQPQQQPFVIPPGPADFAARPAAASLPPTTATPGIPPRAPPGATVQDSPLVGAILPVTPGQAPPGITGPRSTLRPGDPLPQGPTPMPIPPNAQGPTRR